MGEVFSKKIEETSMKKLVALGMRKQNRQRALMNLQNDCLGSVNLNMTAKLRYGFYEMAPMIGFRFDKIHNFVAMILGERRKSTSPMTFATNIGYLIPERGHQGIFLKFYTDFPIDDNIETLASLTKEHVFPYWNRNADLKGEKIVEVINNQTIGIFRPVYSIAAIHVYSLDDSQISEIINNRRDEISSNSIATADIKFLKFIENYSEYVGKSF